MAKILIVEDDIQLSDLYLNTFNFSGFETHVAKDGLDGLSKVSDVNPDMILLDIMMPKMNGIDLLKKLKEQDATRNIPVVILSNFSDESIAKEAMAHGALAYIIKSDYEPSHIVKLVKDILNHTYVPSTNQPQTND